MELVARSSGVRFLCFAPPTHHVGYFAPGKPFEEIAPLGFCLYSPIDLAVDWARQENKKILIADLDCHANQSGELLSLPENRSLGDLLDIHEGAPQWPHRMPGYQDRVKQYQAPNVFRVPLRKGLKSIFISFEKKTENDPFELRQIQIRSAQIQK